MTQSAKRLFLVLFLLTMGATSIALAQTREVRLRANLTAAAAAGDISGQADFRQRNGRRQFSVQVEGLTPGDAFDVMAAGQVVGTITINALGVGDLNYDDNFEAGDDPATRFPANFPAVKAGTSIQVGALSGTVQRK